jgi:serine/threonine protein kinase
MKNFEIIQKLGNQDTRKFSSVFLVNRKLDDKRFVLKCVEKNEKTIIQQEKIRQEAKFQFDRSFFQKTIDFWEDTNGIYLLKEYTEGETVVEWWKKQKEKKIDRLTVLLNGLTPAFSFLKENNLAHNDIKPSNILVTNRNGAPEFVLLDFGLAFYYPELDNQEVLFALGYSSPELVLSKKSTVNHSSDLFSLGIVLYQLWTGKLPLTHPNPTVFTNLQITYPLINAGNVPEKLFQIISKMCFKHQFRLPPNQLSEQEVICSLIDAQKNRYLSIEDIILDLQQVEIKSRWNFLIKIFSKS